MGQHQNILFLNFTLAVLYFALAWLGIQFAISPMPASLFWPAAGASFAFVYIYGPLVLPGVVAGAAAFYLSEFILGGAGNFDEFFFRTFLILLGVAAQAFLSAMLCKRFVGSHVRLEKFTEIVKFSVLSGPVGCLVSASIALLGLLIFNSDFEVHVWFVWLTWYLGDMLGILTAGTALVLLLNREGAISKSRKLCVLAPFLIALLVVYSIFSYTQKKDEDLRNKTLVQAAQKIHGGLTLGFQIFLRDIGSMQSFYDASEFVNEEEFAKFARNNLSYNHGASAFAWAPRVIDREAFEKQFFEVRGLNDQNLMSLAEDKDVYFPALYLQSKNGASQQGSPKSIFGFDFSSEPLRERAIRDAVKTAKPIATDPLILVNSGEKGLGSVVYMPVFEADESEGENFNGEDYEGVKGVLAAAFFYQDLITPIAEDWKSSHVELCILDKKTQQVTFKSPGFLAAVDRDEKMYVHTMNLDFAGREFEVGFHQSKISSQEYLSYRNAWFLLLFSLSFTFLMLLFIFVVTGQTSVVEDEVEAKTIALARQKRFLNIVMDNVPDLISVRNKNFHLLRANSAMLDKFPPDQRDGILDTDGYSRFSNREAEIHRQKDRIAMDAGHAEFLMEEKDYGGNIHSYLYKKVRFEDDEGQPHILTLGQDVTEVTHIQKRLQTVMDTMADGFITISNEGKIESYNKACQDIFGHTAEEALGCGVEILFAEKHAKDIQQGFSKFIENSQDEENTDLDQSYEYEARHKSGNTFPAHIAVSEIQLGGKTYFSAVIRDITKAKADEAELKRSNKELEDFAYVASHDLKAPLRHISMSAEFLSDMYKDTMDEKGRDLLEIIAGGTGRMQKMIDSLLAYSRVGRSDVKFENMKLNGVIDNIMILIGSLLDETNTELIAYDLPEVKGDQYLIVQLFQNLIENAIKYKKPDIDPKIEINVLDEDDAKYTIGVQDNGIGISPDNAEKVFKVFHRLHREEEVQGVGIGLAVCQRIVEFHGGEIWLDTEVKDGCLFKFTLPKVIV